MNVIEVSNLTKSYGKNRGIVDVNLSIWEGEVFGFIGPNGAGKSTTIRSLLGLIFPNSGSARIFGMDCIKDHAKIKRNIGYIPSEVSFYDDMKVGELLKYSAAYYGKAQTARIKELSERLDLDLDKKAEQLSFGNRKKVSIVQALLHEPRLLILDEPTNGLDPLMQSRFFEILREQNQKGVTIFFSSHILSDVQKVCQRVAIIKEGRILKVEDMQSLTASTYKKVKIEFGTVNLQEGFTLPGLSRISQEGLTSEYLYMGSTESLAEEIAKAKPKNLWIEDPSLEEIFVNYYIH